MSQSHPAEVAKIITEHRTRKAVLLADALRAKNFTLDQVRALDNHGWHIVAASAGTKPPSEETVELVIAILEARKAGGTLPE